MINKITKTDTSPLCQMANRKNIFYGIQQKHFANVYNGLDMKVWGAIIAGSMNGRTENWSD